MTTPLIAACTNCNSTTAPLITRAGRLVCRNCWTVGGLLDDDNPATNVAKEVMPHA